MFRIIRASVALALYVGAVLAPNFLIAWLGIVDVAPGPWVLMAPAAVYAVGGALVARDVVDDILGLRGVLAAIVIGTTLSYVFARPDIAIASGAAFVLAELLDLAIYRPLRDRSWTLAALASSLVGAGLDSFVFLMLAFGDLAFLPGQWVGKAIAIAVFVAVAAPTRRWWAPRRRTAVVEEEPELVSA